jgi:hypothetical protein
MFTLPIGFPDGTLMIATLFFNLSGVSFRDSGFSVQVSGVSSIYPDT